MYNKKISVAAGGENKARLYAEVKNLKASNINYDVLSSAIGHLNKDYRNAVEYFLKP